MQKPTSMSSKKSGKSSTTRKPGRSKVVFLNPRTCGINKDGGVRYKVDHSTSRRTNEIDNEMLEQVELYLKGGTPEGMSIKDVKMVYAKGVLVPHYYDERLDREFSELLQHEGLEAISVGELEHMGIITVREGHGSPSNDLRSGHIPYVKVSDIRSLRVNVNPTNMVPFGLAMKYWRGTDSGLKEWDLITPNRASSNIGEFAVILPGEEQIVLTKEVFIFRVSDNKAGWDPFYLLWSLSLRAVRQQWRRVTLMQTNREDVAGRYREVRLPIPKNKEWAQHVSMPFRNYFTTIAEAKNELVAATRAAAYEFVANITTNEGGGCSNGEITDKGDASGDPNLDLFEVKCDVNHEGMIA